MSKRDLNNMTSSRPYLVRALHEWIVDNQMTPYLLVNAQAYGVEVPNQYVEGGRIVLNVSPMAVKHLDVKNDHIAFQARFGGIVEHIFVTMGSVLAIYAKENGRGMAFEEEDEDGSGGKEPPPPPGPPSVGKRHLKVVK